MRYQILSLIALTVVVSGCIDNNTSSDSMFSEYDSNILELESQSQSASFRINREASTYSISTSSPLTAEQFFSSDENKTQKLRQICSSLQQRVFDMGLTRGATGERSFNVLNDQGTELDQRSFNMSRFTQTLENYELTEADYIVPTQDGQIEARCLITGSGEEQLEAEVY